MGNLRSPVGEPPLFVDDTGESNLPVVLCMHSLFLDGRMFDDFVDAAVGRFRVVRPDFRGQGRSPVSDVPELDMDFYAADIVQLVEQMNLQSVNILAQSMGGDVAFRVAHERPDLVASLAVLGSSACAEPPEQLSRFRKWVEDATAQGFTGDVLDYTMEIMIGPVTREDPTRAAAVNQTRARISELGPTLRPAMVGVVERKSALDLLPDIQCPVLIVSGALDLPRPPAWSDQMHELLPNSRLWRLNDVGHSPIIEIPEVVVPELLSFFSDLERVVQIR